MTDLNDFFLRSKIIGKTWFHILILISIGYLLFFFRLGSQDLDYAEAREGQVVLEMHETGNIILPLRAGGIIPSKPPFFHWIGLIVSEITGSVNEFSIRFPSALFGTLGIIITYFLGREIFNTRVGFLSAIFLATTTTYIKLSRGARVDMTLSFFIVLSLLFFILGYKYEHRRKLFFILYFVSASFATMVKGPVGIVLPSIIVFIFLITKKESKIIILRREILIGILIFLIISSSWYILALLKGGEEFFQQQIMKENINRFVGGEGGYGHKHPFYFLFPRTLSIMLPWSIFLPAVIYSICLKSYRKKQKKTMFLITWFFSVLIFFSISVSKRAEYLLPLIPAGVMLIAVLWDDFLLSEGEKWLNRLLKTPVFLFPLMAIPASLIIITALILYSFGITIPSMLHDFMKPRDLLQASFYFNIFYGDFLLDLILAVFSIIWAIYTIRLINKKKLKTSLYSVMIFTFIITNIICLKYNPVIWGDRFVKDFAMEINESLKKEDKLYFYNLEQNDDLKHNIYNGLIFYTSRHLKNLNDLELSKLENQNPPIYLIMEEKYFNHLTSQGFNIFIKKKSELIDFQYKLFLVQLVSGKI